MQTQPIKDLHESLKITNQPEDSLREYHYRRSNRLTAGDFDLSENSRPTILLHVASPNSLDSYTSDNIDAAQFSDSYRDFPAIVRGQAQKERGELCSRGYIAANRREGEYSSATWVDRTGILEAVSTDVFYSTNEGNEYRLSDEPFENSLVKIVEAYIERINDGEQEEVLVTVSYHHLENAGFNTRRGFHSLSFDTPLIETPVVKLGSSDLREELDPLICPVWNALGRKTSPLMEEGNWKLAE